MRHSLWHVLWLNGRSGGSHLLGFPLPTSFTQLLCTYSVICTFLDLYHLLGIGVFETDECVGSISPRDLYHVNVVFDYLEFLISVVTSIY